MVVPLLLGSTEQTAKSASEPSSESVSAHERLRDAITDKHDAEDLVAQLRTADAAEDQARSMRVQTVLSIIGSIFLLWTLYETRRTSIAGVEAARIARTTLERTQRPFVAVLHHTTTWVVDQHGQDIALGVRPRWINRGATPTKNMIISVGRLVTEAPLEDDFEFDGGVAVATTTAYLAPNSEQTGVGAEFTADELLLELQGKLHLYVFGSAEYNDTFDGTPRRKTTFFVELSSNGSLDEKQRPEYGFSNLSTYNMAE